ncbi:type II toxin-antitoxin system VapB family antitoxin [Sphingomonas sp. SUN039]|uniref:type II toxin-antitoxin system VapB family antitoxin n=1 Tax=Sphingomonas sp. SUN039 TaxID=2937787 RepID=UPI0021647667|nr:type II toxin-antitoxin system VapB family antitoxin [Sphingomonas sp. SUN039]UVO53374.1 type II toxin-antitoxin system VapB family antitoxin [Sphingomonas sp. SUN039]
MAFHVRDVKVDYKVRDLARKEGVGLTRAIELAVEERLAKHEPTLLEKLRKRQEALAAVRVPITDGMTDKEFDDWINGEDER